VQRQLTIRERINSFGALFLQFGLDKTPPFARRERSASDYAPTLWRAETAVDCRSQALFAVSGAFIDAEWRILPPNRGFQRDGQHLTRLCRARHIPAAIESGRLSTQSA